MSDMRDRVARIIDPVAFKRWEEAYRRKDQFDMVQNITPMVEARAKADAVIELLMHPDETMIRAGMAVGENDKIGSVGADAGAVLRHAERGQADRDGSA